jgi:hypothetical protein
MLLRKVEDFCVGRAESEEVFLEDTFIFDNDFLETLHAPPNSPVLLVGRKGTGKSALLKFIELKSKSCGVRCLYIKPDDIPLLEGISSAEETATIKRKAHEALVSAISVKVGTELRGLLGKKDKKLFDKAILDGSKSHDSIQACLRGLAKFGATITDVNFDKLVPKTTNSNVSALSDALKSNFTNTDKLFFLLLDDVDQVASLENQAHINRIWGFILAAQKLTEELPNFKTIICLRTEVWSILEGDKYGQRDQVDHVRRLIRRLDPSDKVMDIYRTLYPTPGWADSLEIETFSINLEKLYGFDASTVTNEEVTLGELFRMIKNPNHH